MLPCCQKKVKEGGTEGDHTRAQCKIQETNYHVDIRHARYLGSPWLRVAAATSIAPCSTRAGLKVLPRRSRQGAAKCSSVEVATELARLVCRRRTFGPCRMSAKRSSEPHCVARQRSRVVASTVRGQRRNKCNTRDDEKTTMSACELQCKYLRDGTSALKTHDAKAILTSFTDLSIIS